MDLNNDGNIDLIGAGFAGITYVLYGKPGGSFNKAIVLQNKKGNNLRLAHYYDFEKKAYVKDEELGEVDKGDFSKFHDWDNDGDLDLIMSGGRGAYLFINEGNKAKPIFSNKYTKIIPAHFADVFVDWDNDGLWDIVGGSKSGGVYFYKNKGKLGAPKFDEPITIFTKEEIVCNIENATASLTEVACSDYNNDGKPDLIMGVYTRIKHPAPKLTAEQLKEKELLQIQLKEQVKKLDDYMTEFGKKKNITDKFKIKTLIIEDEGFKNLSKERRKINIKLNNYRERSSSHGYIFVSTRK